ncbi:uncharacterized protein LOC133785653 [Humulus lupulus]|uniref:uncharacterized protein LOC133785653 n=1 Tax=Humulus lupulus TaxID=3486 RepID=UPI002B403FCE|nr:uncharacterized protein LOC133785653 [Humulus lupulus]
MVCVVLGANPPLSVFEGFINRMWGKLGIERIARMNGGYTLVKFRDEATRDLVLEAGVVHFDRKPVLLRPWATGKPMMMDMVTKDKSMVKFARVLVDVEISDNIPQCISFLNESGQLMEQPIEFEWLPTRCSCCNNLGHGASNCERSQVADKDSQQQRNCDNLAGSRELKTGNDSVQDAGNSSVGQDLSWSTPKRVGGVKIKAAANVTVRGNKFSLLQESKEMVTKRNLHDPQPSNGGILGGFLETKLKNKKIEEMMMNFFVGWKWYSSEVVEGRILLVWREDIVQVNIIHVMDQLVHCEVRIKGSMNQTLLSFVYGRNTLEERKLLWPHLLCPKASAAPWLVVGDFNAIFDYGDRIGGREVSHSEVADSSQWRASVLITELRSNGSFFTWSNNQHPETRIYSKLDRVLVNEKWSDSFPDSEARIFWDTLSDHCYCIIKTVQFKEFGIKPFRFYNCWSTHEDFRVIVLDCWLKPAGGIGLQQVLLKLKRLIPILSRFNKQQVGDQEESDAARDFANKSCSYESFLRQKSKINWLRFGDENTAYFRASLKQRKMRNRISSFINDEGHIVENYPEVIDHFYNHFRGVMGKVSLASRQIDQNCFKEGHTLTLEQQLRLIQPFTRKDVRRALFSIPSIKSPGPNGYGSGFFKALWRDIGAEISDAVLLFFTTGEIPTELNRTILTLIPKVDSPSVASDFRPIDCYQNQGAFVKNRQLAHNIQMLQDLLHGYSRKNISPRCLLKIDISKAYDSVDWAFLEEILSAFCFPRKFIKWIMVCLSDSSYTLLMNGRLQGSFEGRKGLRQGDPISPLLFVLVMEYLTRLLKQVANHREFRFHPLCKHLHLVNLCFADDLILFCKGNYRSVQLMFEGFLSFCNSSGLAVNLNKSQIYLGGVAAEVKLSILNLVALGEGNFPLKYLGFSLRPTKWQAADCGVIIKKIQTKLHMWASRHLSFAGRTQLIFSVLLSIRNYWMHVLLLPISDINEIDRLCRNFLWGSSNSRSKLHCTSWAQVCLPKSLRGLGFMEGAVWNKVLMAKFIWALSTKQDMLWVKWIDGIYLKGHSFWSYNLKADVSWYWHKLCYLREFVFESKLVSATVNGSLRLKVLLHSTLQRQSVAFAKDVWCCLSVPKHRFILWQSVLGHLLTRDNLVRCQVAGVSVLCPVCEQEEESHQHLFFDCWFSQQVWSLLKGWLGTSIWPAHFADWKEWLNRKPRSVLHSIYIAVLAATVYGMWYNRNSCIFSGYSYTPWYVVRMIKKAVKYRLYGRLSQKVLRQNCSLASLVDNM